MIHPLVKSWPITMPMVITAFLSTIHSHLVAAPTNLERDAIILIVALVQCTTLVVQ